MFQLDERLMNDTITVGSFALCEVLLMNDANYPWVILVPRREAITEIYQLTESDQQLLIEETAFVSQKMQMHFQAKKMNVAALGNVVSQLHMHCVARYDNDAAWPGPVWGVVPVKPYNTEELQLESDSLRALLAEKIEIELL